MAELLFCLCLFSTARACLCLFSTDLVAKLTLRPETSATSQGLNQQLPPWRRRFRSGWFRFRPERATAVPIGRDPSGDSETLLGQEPMEIDELRFQGLVHRLRVGGSRVSRRFVDRLADHYWAFQGTMFWAIFVLGHDCGHGSFSDIPILNSVVGHVLHSSILVPYHGWRISHKTHHQNHGYVLIALVFRNCESNQMAICC